MSEPGLATQVFPRRPKARGIGGNKDGVSSTMHTDIENRHSQPWSKTRAPHREQTLRVAAFRCGRLEPSRNTRLAIRETQLTRAGNDHTCLWAAQKAIAQVDSDRRVTDCEHVASTTDTTVQSGAWELMRVST